VNVTRHGAVRIAASPAEMVEHVNRYLDDPSLDAAGRRSVVAEQCQFTDGRSGERVTAGVVAELADVLGRALNGGGTDRETASMASA
jgi:hypothetical protein